MKYDAFSMAPKGYERFCNGNSRHPRVRMSKSQIKILITVFDIKDIVHVEFIPRGQILKLLRVAVLRKGPEP
jgi:hypothetical protein